ncbi:MAG: Asp-tRNA(Asn)/Glu-tRNA(Gln) amidotransferase subunit GatA [Dorea sp.]|jgi:aspartyl-tRNA(Asn)/glutamyl-tRNA(Gln) amidotransferase subunit A|nr:Asp-tRNA(Asn)/Glu-tRNA(Gln) amidotransferase subunit GatA [Provencibacterium sp.]MCI9490179.1 Asp-tRNA(Asn)/Glu-tRNA(Gln) amidotransferase subunit GatA [Dorea sp.]
MTRTEITALGVWELSQALRAGELTALEAAESYLAAIEERDGTIGAYLTVTKEQALAAAEETDRLRRAGEALPLLAGIPGALKDNLCTEGVRTTCASRMLERYIPPYSAHVVEKLMQSRAVLLGKLNMDEFAMGSSTENSAFHPTRNPVDPVRAPGGSSGGSAAAVAAGEAAFALGSDTGGSIRQPAAFCGVVGMKPTYGAVSRYGLVAFASSLDQIGPITRTVRDNALLLSQIAGHDERDSTSLSGFDTGYAEDLERGARGLRLALPEEYFSEGISPAVSAAVREAARRFQELGAELVSCRLPLLRHALPAYYILSSAEASANLARFDGVKYGFRAQGCTDLESLYLRSRSEGFGPEVRRRILLGSFVLSAGYYDAYYRKAQQARTLLIREFGRLLADCDAILAPVAPTTAYRLGEKTADPLEMYLGDIYTAPVNLAGLPALSMPCGRAPDGLPVGMQLIGPAFGERMLYRLGHAYETAYPATAGQSL